jgi:hypothetical protein
MSKIAMHFAVVKKRADLPLSAGSLMLDLSGCSPRHLVPLALAWRQRTL